MNCLVLLRHGESLYNAENRFTGWTNIDLSPKGKDEARMAGELFLAHGFIFDAVFSSVLIRAIRTADIVSWIMRIKGTDRHFPLPSLTCNEALNERHYGILQGEDKDAIAKQYGKELTHAWRRSYDAAPPSGESLKNVAERTIPYFQKHIEPLIWEGKNVLIVAHHHSLRSVVMHLDTMDNETIAHFEIQTGKSLVYEFNVQRALVGKHFLS
ncbi:MAG: 2,3-diphosphoglycerate-dependent phosphoglycerate mutase [bacterium]|nr:2,3-diphosphoglycerate-dependent phosphoglycerate mutase [bacterium]